MKNQSGYMETDLETDPQNPSSYPSCKDQRGCHVWL